MTLAPGGRRTARQAAWRFLLIGATNTLATTALLVGLSYLMPGWLAYTVSFALGLAYSTIFAARWVFTSDGSARAASLYALCYLAIFLIGLVVIAGIHALSWPAYANALSVIVTAPLGFVAGRIVFTQRKEGRDD
ncbi:GtrA family protein [Microbacterium testaceum]|uniref:GtrA family protein n=1 Tax=Microbacterium testaceum TaxID=2033 RepID=UPI0025B1208E|nr:GtrA family protein [Microbacterium testaceum]WJS91739.1 GtrA family protein [Microbacterium testaceum]